MLGYLPRGLAERPPPMLGYPGAGSTHNVVRTSHPSPLTNENQVVVARRAEKLQNARAPEKDERFVETTGNTLEAAVECALWRSAGLDRALKIDPSAKTLPIFSQRRCDDARTIDQKSPQNGRIFPATSYQIPGYPARRGAGAPKMMLGYPDMTGVIIP